MATIRVCDKCGAEISKSDERFVVKLERDFTSKYVPVYYWYDMCETCANKVRGWIEAKEEQDASRP